MIIDLPIDDCDRKFLSKTTFIQLWYGLWVCLVDVSVGLSYGFSTATINQLSMQDPPILINTSDEAWISNVLNLFAPLGCLISGYVMDKYGRKVILIICEVPVCVGWLVITCASTVKHIIIGRIITGVGCGLAMGGARAYISEITLPHLRGVVGVFPNLGKSVGLFLQTPHLFLNNMVSPQDWAYRTEPQEGACRGYKNHRCAWPRGKALGGSSSINFMYYVRGNKADYDEWAAAGNKGWSYDEVLPYFMKSENFSGVLNEHRRKYHSTGGYLGVTDDTSLHDFERMLLSAIEETGIPIIGDINEESQMGAAKASTTTKDGVRYSTARSFLSPIKDRKNLHVIKNAHATKILFKPGTNEVNGVLINKDGRDITVNAKKEVISSAGAINSPHLLLLSGIGPEKQLTNLGIDVKADLPVGENLLDHVFVPFFYTLPGENKINAGTIAKEIYNYVMHRKGPFVDTSPHRIMSLINTTDSKAVSPDLQFHYFVYPPGAYNILDIFQKHDLRDDIQKQYREINENNYVMIIYSVLEIPKSKGRIILKSKDPKVYPLIYANYFDDEYDLKVVIDGFKRHIVKLGDTKAFKAAGFKLKWLDLEECKNYEKGSDKFLDCYSRVLTFSLYHPTTSAKMGPDGDSTSVVDPELRVRNVKYLRVIDASIMPNNIRGNTNAPTIMIAEKGSDFIKKTWLSMHSEL